LQEPYTVLNNVAGFPKPFKIFAHGVGRKITAIIVSNNNIDAIAIKQVSYEDAILIELRYEGSASMEPVYIFLLTATFKQIWKQWRKSYSSQKVRG
jgi:SAM-dependent MidA family methyltransferase